uniref:Uncharacterized protein n=1 Tax=Timema shepardi TaxID=629360 RepID=A0A7R9BAE4_TIMSH|nr:unnamed protein product [Timema shepardi]
MQPISTLGLCDLGWSHSTVRTTSSFEDIGSMGLGSSTCRIKRTQTSPDVSPSSPLSSDEKNTAYLPDRGSAARVNNERVLIPLLDKEGDRGSAARVNNERVLIPLFIASLRGHVQAVYQVAWSADSRLLVSGSSDSTLKVWSTKSKKLEIDLPGHADEVYAVDWSPDGARVASGGKDKVLRL